MNERGARDGLLVKPQTPEVRWLRPDYQIPRFARGAVAKTGQLDLGETVVAIDKGLPVFPRDPAKALSNRAKHGVRFEDAMSVFADPLALSRPDDPAPAAKSGG